MESVVENVGKPKNQLLRFEQADQRHSDLLAMMNQRFDQVDQRFNQVDQRFNQMEQQRQEDRQVMLQQFQQMEQRRQEDRQEINQRFAQHETRLESLENWMRTTFVTLALVAVGVAAQLFYILMRLGLKPLTGTGGPVGVAARKQ
ncbi:MAG: hypothetical protein ETSY1_26025 [Candidatus Entotheonella factor]|uniref:Uncharacterized protein n=1 Tax=Entotheonella factor TaxID=1429438 RepID=W4LGW9_ENTF1|nr:MAG: hypothetical protein ETSY1_26025 [Candidatus Entotheonella factor]